MEYHESLKLFFFFIQWPTWENICHPEHLPDSHFSLRGGGVSRFLLFSGLFINRHLWERWTRRLCQELSLAVSRYLDMQTIWDLITWMESRHPAMPTESEKKTANEQRVYALEELPFCVARLRRRRIRSYNAQGPVKRTHGAITSWLTSEITV